MCEERHQADDPRVSRHVVRGGPALRQGGRRGAVLQLLALLLLTWATGLTGSVVVANVVRALVGVEIDLLTAADGAAPVSVGVLAYAQGTAALGLVALLSAAALLAGAVELTRTARSGEQVRAWTPFLRGLSRTPAVARGLAVVLLLAALAVLVSAVLLVLSVVLLPAAAVLATIWWRRPAWRRSWMRGLLVAAVPLGVGAAVVVRWALWLPFVVVDGAGIRAALRHSADTASGRVLRTARSLTAVAVLAVVPATLLAGSSALGAPAAVVGVGTLLLVVGLLVALAVVATVLHEDVALAAVVPRQRPPARRLRRLAPSPAVTLVLLIGLLAQSGWSAPVAAADAPTASAVTVVVTSLGDALDTAGQCASDSATCTLRAAVETAPAGGTVVFGVTGAIQLVQTLHVRQSLTIDGTGQRITLRSPSSGTAVLLGAGSGGGDETPPGGGDETPPGGGDETPPEQTAPAGSGSWALRNLTFLGAYADGHGVLVGSGSAIVENATFTRHKTLDTLGSALYAANGGLSVVNSTFVDNSAMTAGGTVAASPSVPLSVNASTFVGNHGGGVRGAGATIANSVFRGASGGFNCDVSASVSGNVSNDGSCATDVGGVPDPSRTSLTDAQLALQALGDSTGPVETVALRAGSAAIAAGAPATCPSHDARGEVRGGTCDAGAYQTANGTTTTIGATNPAPFGSPITVTVTVTNPQGAPTGSVELTGTPAGTSTASLTAGTGLGVSTAAFTLTPPAGTHALQATYVPDAGLSASTGSLDLVVQEQTSATTLEVTPAGSSRPGTPVTLTARVANGGDVAHEQPTGSVDFASGSTALGRAALVAGVATWTGVLPLGSHDLTAVYLPGNGFLTSTGTARHSVRSVSRVTVDAPGTVVHGAPFTLHASLPAGATGRVVFSGRTTDRVWSSAPVPITAGTATTQWTQVLAPGQWSFTAEYGGDESQERATSEPADTTVTPAGTGVVLTGPSRSTTSGQPAPFTATVDARLTPALPTGSVELRADGTLVASAVLVDGVASLAPTGIPVGTDRSLVATYLPDTAGFTTSASTAVPHTVSRGSTTTRLAAPATSRSGETVALVATVAPVAPSTAAPAGHVTFSAGSTDLGSAALVDGVATLSTTALPVGTSALTASATPTSELAGSTSSALQHAVSRSATTVSLTSDEPAPGPGQPLTLTATVAVTAPGSGTPTGTVAFRDGTAVLATVPVSGGSAVLHLAGLTGGTHALTATYAGDASRTGSDVALTVTVAKVAALVQIVDVSPEPSRFGSPVTVVVSVRGATGLPVSGDVELTWGGSTVVGRAAVLDGVATVVVSDLGVGRTTLAARFLGDAHHVAAADEALTWHTVLPATPPVLLSSEASPTRYGERIRLFADVSPVAGRVPTGAVTFTVAGGVPVRSTHFDAAGRASADVYPGRAGLLGVSVSVAGDPWFEPLRADGLVHEVTAGSATVTLESVAPAVVGEPTSLIARVGPAAAHGIGGVRFFDGADELGIAAVDDLGRAVLRPTFGAKGVHRLTALYDNTSGTFDQVRSAPLLLPVAGRAVSFGMLAGGSTYGDDAAYTVRLFTTRAHTDEPTGSVSVRLGDRDLGTAALGTSAPLGQGVMLTTKVPLGRSLEPGSYAVTVTYSGDAAFETVSQPATLTVDRRLLVTSLDPPAPSPALAGQPVRLSGRIALPPTAAGVLPPTGTLQLGRGGASCTVPIGDGGGSCTVAFRGDPAEEQLHAVYSGDSRYWALPSPTVRLPVVRSTARIELSTALPDGGTWNDAEAGSVTWRTTATTPTPVQGRVEVWTSEGQQASCPTTSTGSCDVRFSAATTSGWVEVRFAGDATYVPSTRRQVLSVLGCHDVRATSGGRVLTAPNCGRTKYLAGTAVSLEAPERPGSTFLGWATDRTPGTVLEPSPLGVGRDLVAEPRYQPVCFTLSVTSYPASLRTVTPSPAPDCDDAVDPSFTPRDVGAIARSEVAAGRMRYRVGTRVELPTYSERLSPTMTAPVRWYGEGVSPEGVLTVRGDVELEKRLEPACRAFVVDGPPGATTSIVGSSFDTSVSPLLARSLGGTCARGDGSRGYLPGTVLRVALTPAAGTWFERWGSLEPLSRHRAPTAAQVAVERPADIARVGRSEATTVVVPDRDTGMSGFTSAVTCHRLDVTVEDAVLPGQLRRGDRPASVATTAANCPSWWLVHEGRPAAEHARWYLAGTDVTLTASGTVRWGTVDEFVTARQIDFRGWSGGVSGRGLVQQVRMDGPVTATAQWYVSARCAGVVVRTQPAGAGEVVMSGLGTECPKRESAFAGVAPTPQAPLGSTVSLAARPMGALQVIWKVEGRSVTNTQACLAREDEIQRRYDEGYEAGRSKDAIDQTLMVQGYLPGLTVSRVQQEAARMQALGWTQQNIVGDLERMGLLQPSGALTPDRLRANPCERTEVSTVHPAGQRGLTTTVEGSMVYTAHFCQAVDPSVTIVGLDGVSAPATPGQLAAFGGLFRSSSSAGNCPTPGWFSPGTTAELGAGGTGVAGYVLTGWKLDGTAKPAGPLSVPISATAAPRSVAATVQVVCHRLTVAAQFGHTAYPLPNCPGAAPSRNLYAEGTKVTVTAGPSGGHALVGWHETGSSFNPTIAVMDQPRTLTANFRAKSVGEVMKESVIDPALDAAGIAAKKAVGGIAYTIKVVGDQLIDGAILGTLSSLGTALQQGFAAIGVQGVVLDQLALALQVPQHAFAAGFAGFDCVQEWAWGTSLPTLGDLKTTVTSAVKGEAKAQVAGVEVDTVLAEAQLLAAKMAAGDPAALAQAYITAAGGGPAVMVVHLALDISAHPEVWQERATDAAAGAGAYALDLLAEEFGTGFTWEASATEAWTTGGDAFLSCMADNGKAIAGG